MSNLADMEMLVDITMSKGGHEKEKVKSSLFDLT